MKNAWLIALGLIVVSQPLFLARAEMKSLGSIEKRRAEKIFGNLKVIDDRAAFKEESAVDKSLGRFQPTISVISGDTVNKALSDKALQNGKDIPLTVYKIEDRVVGIAPQSVGISEAVRANAQLKQEFEGLFPQINSAEWDRAQDNYQLRFIKALDQNANASSIEDAVEQNRALRAKLSEGAVSLFKKALKNETVNISAETVSALQAFQTSLDKEERHFIEKGVTRDDSNYRVETFGMVIANANASGRIQTRDGKSTRGSCVHLGNGYFLTAAHVLKAADFKKLEVEFPAAGTNFFFTRILDLSTSQTNTPKLDITLCRTTNNLEALVRVGAARPKQSLIRDSNDYLEESTGLYVIGFPKDSAFGLTVHDDCRIVVPRWVSRDKIVGLYLKLTLGQIAGICEPSAQFNATVGRLRLKFARLYGFDISTFQPSGSLPPGYVASLDGATIIGLDSDTSPGDSGSGVFEKRSGELVGIFGGGIPNAEAIPAATAEEFEYAVPLESFWNKIQPLLNQ